MIKPTPLLKREYGFEAPFRPDPLAVKALRYLNGGKRLLDVGCGEGADSVLYARNGFDVTAIDNSETYLSPFRKYVKNKKVSNISIEQKDVLNYNYKENYYDVINCLLVGCCMKKSEFEKLLGHIKKSIKAGGTIIMSLRNYLDPEYKDCIATETMIEENTFYKKDDCCKIRYFIEKDRLREVFSGFEILYYHEGFATDKYGEDIMHGDSYIICRKSIAN